jgi:uncharacterized membrane protein YcaP (DUF421 family)
MVATGPGMEHRMLALESSWLEIIARVTVVYAALFAMVRLSGKRTIGQFTPFDLVVVLLLSEAVSSALTGGDNSVGAGLLAAATLVVLNGLLAFAASRSRKVENFLEGRPVLLGRDGELYLDVMRRERIGAEDVKKALRENDCPLHELDFLLLETDGTLSVRKRR